MPLRTNHLDMLIDLLGRIDERQDANAFGYLFCESMCALSPITRSIFLLYRPGRDSMTAVGSCGLPAEVVVGVEGTIDDSPAAFTALSENRVVVSDSLDESISPRLHAFARTPLTCVPVAGADKWFGVIFGDAGGAPYTLSDSVRAELLTLGRLAALAATMVWAAQSQARAREYKGRIELNRHIHDQVIQKVFGVSVVLGSGKPIDPEVASRCSDELQGALRDLRDVLETARPTRTTDTTVEDILIHLPKRFPGLKVENHATTLIPDRLQPLIQATLEEAVRNARKHAGPDRILVELDEDEISFELTVTNDGLGMTADESRAEEVRQRRRVRRMPNVPGTGMGLRILRMDAIQHDGMLGFGETRGGEWRVRLTVPKKTDD